jgi:hypothetical protein
MDLDLLLVLHKLLALYRPQFHTTPLFTHSTGPDISSATISA